MALLTSTSATNRVIDSGLVVAYTVRRIYGNWVSVALNTTTTYTKAWEYTRHAQKSYRYVGLTYDAAVAAANALVSYYTRAIELSEWDESSGEFVDRSGGSVPMASVALQHDEGDAWTVAVTVDEVDVRQRRVLVSAKSLFSTERQRKYDGETETA